MTIDIEIQSQHQITLSSIHPAPFSDNVFRRSNLTLENAQEPGGSEWEMERSARGLAQQFR